MQSATNTKKEEDVIAFYSHNPNKYLAAFKHLHCFSNFSAHSVVIGEKSWPTTEHYYQAMKFPAHPEYQEQIRNASSPSQAKAMGNNRSHTLREDWDTAKVTVMHVALMNKFTQNGQCKQALLSTGDAYLEERTKNDRIWGTGSDAAGGTGMNLLGKGLMKVREEIRNKK